jgi:hypothetical protein
MRRTVRVAGVACGASSLLVASSAVIANSGTQLPLNQYQAGTEQTSSSIVTNGGFEMPGTPNPNQPTGWTLVGTMQAGTPLNPPTPAGPVGSFAAQGPLGNNADPNKYTQDITLAPATDYVISAYIWNFGQAAVGTEFGDLAVAEVVDVTNLGNTKTLSLERVASDMGDGANGYFIYDSFNSNQFPSGIVLEVEADFGENVPGARPNIWAQIDNVAITLASEFVPPIPFPATSTWNVDANGIWTVPANWQGGVPDGIGRVVNFGSVITAPRTVTLDSNRTVGSINFDNPNKYTIAGTALLTLDVVSGTAGLNVMSLGSHEIMPPIQLNDSLAVNVQLAGSSLRLSGQMTAGAGLTLTKSGAGLLEMKNVRIANLSVGGTLRVLADGTSAATSNVNTLAVESGARLDVTNNAFVVNYPPNDAEPFDTIKALITQAYNGGAWDAPGITSSLANNTTHGVGYAEASSLATIAPIFGTVDGTAVLFRYTRYGDANLDGTVNLQDFNRLAANFGTTAGDWSKGDFNYDNNVNLQDFNRLAGQFGLSVSPDGPTPQDWASLAVAVPEPAWLNVVAMVSFLLPRRRKTRELPRRLESRWRAVPGSFAVEFRFL